EDYEANLKTTPDRTWFNVKVEGDRLDGLWDGMIKRNSPYILSARPKVVHAKEDSDDPLNSGWRGTYYKPTLESAKADIAKYYPPAQVPTQTPPTNANSNPYAEKNKTEYTGLPPAYLNKFMEDNNGMTPKEVQANKQKVLDETMAVNKQLLSMMSEEDKKKVRDSKQSPSQYYSTHPKEDPRFIATGQEQVYSNVPQFKFPFGGSVD